MTVQILAPGLTAAVSTTIDVAAGAVVTVGIYAATDAQPPNHPVFTIEQTTPGAVNKIGTLDGESRFFVLDAPGTYQVRREAYDGTPFGVFKSPA